MKKIFLSSGPFSIHLAALLLRLTSALMMVHGWNKLAQFSEKVATFPDPLHVGTKASLSLTIFAELFCTAFIVIGLFTRLSLIPLIICMAVIIFMVDAGQPWMESESAIMYLMLYLILFFTGPGNYSADKMLLKK